VEVPEIKREEVKTQTSKSELHAQNGQTSYYFKHLEVFWVDRVWLDFVGRRSLTRERLLWIKVKYGWINAVPYHCVLDSTMGQALFG